MQIVPDEVAGYWQAKVVVNAPRHGAGVQSDAGVGGKGQVNAAIDRLSVVNGHLEAAFDRLDEPRNISLESVNVAGTQRYGHIASESIGLREFRILNCACVSSKIDQGTQEEETRLLP